MKKLINKSDIEILVPLDKFGILFTEIEPNEAYTITENDSIVLESINTGLKKYIRLSKEGFESLLENNEELEVVAWKTT